MARALGYAPMPWQIEAWRVAGELDDTGRMAYPVVVWIVPRRAGKSLGVLANTAQRLTTSRLYRARYTAQTRQDAARTFRDEWVPPVLQSPAASALFTARLSNGDEQLRLPRLGSALSLFSPRETSLHGQPSDLAVVDEAWAFDALAGDKLEAAIRPTFKTRPRPQLWIVSAAGDYRSTWLARWRDLGRAGTPGVAYLEYSADPELDDPDDPDTLARVHPAVGHTIRAIDVLEDAATMPRAEYLRAYFGIWPDAPDVEAVIPPAAWAACRRVDDLDAIRAAPRALAAASGPDGTSWALAGAWTAQDGRTVVQLLDLGPGSERAVQAAHDAQARWRQLVTVDAFGPAGPLVDALRAGGVALDVVTTDRYARACAALLADVLAGQLWHTGQPALDAAVASAGRRPIGDRWAWQRRAGDVSALEAVTLAAAGARHAPGKPRLRVPGTT